MNTRIMVADDHAVVRRGLIMILRADPRLEVVAEASDGGEALTQGMRPEVDLAIMDLAMPRVNGLEVTRQLTSARPSLRVVVLSMYESPQYVAQARKAGAHAYLFKSTVDRDLVETCHAVMRSAEFVHPVAPPRAPIQPASPHADGDVRLTPRETEVAALIASGMTSREIAEHLTISVNTVERHRDNLMAKLDIHNRAELTRYAISHGLVRA